MSLTNEESTQFGGVAVQSTKVGKAKEHGTTKSNRIRPSGGGGLALQKKKEKQGTYQTVDGWGKLPLNGRHKMGGKWGRAKEAFAEHKSVAKGQINSFSTCKITEILG